MNLIKHFIQTVKNGSLFTRQNHLLLAVSGGVDSVALCELCHQAGFRFTIAHCNFKLRGEESDRDENFVRSLAERYATSILIERFETARYAEEHRLSIQVAARELRYNWFDELLQNKAAYLTNSNLQGSSGTNEILHETVFHCVLTAHHADDNIETMLMNFFKGTGITGMRGILPSQGKIVRPLLDVHKSFIVEFAREHQLAFVEDSSNATDKYTRNYFRNQLLPAVAKVYPNVEENLSANLRRFREVELLYRQAVDVHKKRLLEQKGNEFHIPVLKLKQSVPLQTIVYEIIKEFGFSAPQTLEVLALLDSESGKYVQSGEFRVIRNRNWLIIAPNRTTDSKLVPVPEGTTRLSFEQGTLSFTEQASGKGVNYADMAFQDSPNVAHIDSEMIRFPLLLRKRAQGDYFYPLGMAKKKKVSRFLSDQKASVTEKENTWVLEMDKKIIWVIGRRIDDRFKVGVNTGKILRVSFSPNGS